MSQRIDLGSPAFTRLFQNFQDSAFRLETLQVYAEPVEATPLAQFRAGRDVALGESKQRWTSLVRSKTAAGADISRVHIVEEPLSGYMKYELLIGYPPNAEAGERIHILPFTAGDRPETWPTRDFWLFDSKTIAFMEYDEAGVPLAALIDTDPAEAARAAKIRDQALEYAVAYDDYMDDAGL